MIGKIILMLMRGLFGIGICYLVCGILKDISLYNILGSICIGIGANGWNEK